MSIRDDKIQIRVEIDGQAGINELGKLEMEAQQLRASMKGLKKDSQEYADASNALAGVKDRMAEVREEVGLAGLSMRQLRQYQQDLKREWDGALPGTEKFQQLDTDLKEVNARVLQMAGDLKKPTESFEALHQKVGLAGMSMGELLGLQKELKGQWDGALAGTEEFAQIDDNLNRVTAHINDQNGVLGKWGAAWQDAKKELFSFGVQAAVAFAATAVVAGIQSMVKSAADLSDELADLEKTTGMSNQEAQTFNSTLRTIDTRTPTKELRAIAIAAGQLGLAKKDIASFVEATDKLVVSLGDEFQGGAEEVTKVMGGLRNVFLDVKSADIATDMLHIGNSINVLASAGAATGPVVADFANRIGGVGITMGLASGQVLGLSATMQELQITTERGGTAVVKILQAMAKSPAEFAKVAKMSTQAFTDLVNNDIYGAFVKVTEGAAASGAGAVTLAQTLDKLGVDGAGASEVMAKLGTNTAMLQEKVQLATGSLKATDSVMAEFGKKNDDLAGKIEKLTKAMAGSFNVTGWLKPMLDGLVEWGLKLTGVTSEASNLTAAWREQKQAVADATTVTAPLIDRYDQLKKQATLNVTEQKELDTIIAQLAKTIPSAVTGFDKYGKALGLNTKEMRAWLQQRQDMLAVKNTTAIAATELELEGIKRTIAARAVQMQQMQKNYAWLEEKQKSGALMNAQDITKPQIDATLGKWQADVDRLEKKASGLRGILEELTGIKSPETIAAEAAAEKAAAEARAAADKKAAEDAVVTLGYLEQIDARIKALREAQLKVAESDAPQIAAIQKQIRAQEDLRARLLGEVQKKEEKKSDDQRQKEHDKILADFRKLQDDVHQAREKVNLEQLSQDERELQQVAQKYDEMEAAANGFYRNEKLSLNERGLALLEIQRIQEAKRVELEQLAEKQRKARAAKQFEQMSAEVEAEASLRVILARAALSAAPNDTSKDGNGMSLIDKLAQAEQVQIERTRDLKLAALENYRVAEELTAEQVEQRRLQIIADSQAQIDGIRQASREQQKQRDIDQVTEFMQLAGQMADTVYKLIGAADQAEIRRQDKMTKDRLAKLAQEYKTGIITKEEYERRKGDVEATAARQTAAAKKEAAQHEKAGAIVQATIQGIVATVRALADGGPFAGPGLAVIMGALAAAQVAMLIAQPIPEFREGGYTTKEALALPKENLAQNSGGLLTRGPFLATVNEAGPEYFVPNRLLSDPTVAQHVQAIDAIRTGSSTMHGFEAGGYSSSSAATPAPPTWTTNSTAPAPLSEATGQQLLASMNRLAEQWSTGVRAEVVPEQLARTQKLINTIHTDASF
jgi:TP901 family phage tail tape measure protein